MPGKRARSAGRLIAVEGTRGRDVARAAARVWARVKNHSAGGGVSRWDGSGLFYELHLAKHKELTSSPRILLLLYASDLAFRLRWQIRPALEHGHTVVAAPYVESAIALGEAAGLPRKWLVELFRFAPPPDACVHVKEKKESAGWKDRWQDGFAEFASVILKSTWADWDERATRAAAIKALAGLADKKGCQSLKKKALRELKKAVRK